MLVLLYVTVVSDVQVKTFIVLILTVAVINGFLLLWLSFLVADCVLLSSLYPLSVVSVVLSVVFVTVSLFSVLLSPGPVQLSHVLVRICLALQGQLNKPCTAMTRFWLMMNKRKEKKGNLNQRISQRGIISLDVLHLAHVDLRKVAMPTCACPMLCYIYSKALLVMLT